jgi:hypothetical protein
VLDNSDFGLFCVVASPHWMSLRESSVAKIALGQIRNRNRQTGGGGFRSRLEYVLIGSTATIKLDSSHAKTYLHWLN